MASHPIYHFYAELDDYTPKIWRRFQVTDDITVAKLGYIIQVLFEMKASHLMAIEVPESENYNAYLRTKYPDLPPDDQLFHHEEVIYRYEIMDEYYEEAEDIYRNVRTQNAAQARLHNAVCHPNDKLSFNYDFGDNWWVSLTLEKVFTDKDLPGEELPRVLEGAGFGIVEDVGGVSGLESLVKAFKKKKGAEYKEFSEWLGADDFDITVFDLDDMNFRLKKLPRIYKKCYEDRLYPTQRSIDLIERKYLRKKP